MRRFALLLVVAAAHAAYANGRPPGTSDIHFRTGHEQDVLAGMTFGLVISHDGGTTWHWMCEKAVHYGGMYDPIYAYASSGGIFATTFDGFRVMRDGCNFDATMLAMDSPPHFASTMTVGPDGAIYVAMADVKDGKVYRSTDDGMTFPQATMPGQINDWWESIAVAPSDATRVYLSGYRLVSGNPRVFLLFKSINSGQAFSPLAVTDFSPVSQNSTIDIVGVSTTNPDILYARVTLASGNIGDDLYVSTNGGTSWTKILSLQDSIAFLVRANGDIVAGTQTLGAQISHNNGTSWTPLPTPPHLSCLIEKSNGEVWGCTLNYGSMQVQADGFGIMKTTDLMTWSPVMKYQDITGPEDCAAPSLQKTECIDNTWCGLRDQLGITSTVITCAAAPDMSADITHKPPKGCCDTGDGVGPMTLALGALVGMLIGRPRRRRS